MTEEFDPTRVPPFPVINITLKDDDTVTLDGKPVEIGLDQSPKDAGMKAAASRCAELGLDSVRVRAVGPDGTHLMVVTAEGAVYPLNDDSAPVAKSGRAPRRGLGIALATAVVVVAVGAGVGVWAAVNANPAPTPSAFETPGAGANVPVVAPPGYSQKAAWSVPVNDNVTPLLVAADQIAFVTAENRLQIRDTATGRTLWQAQGRQSLRGDIHTTTISGVPVLATDSSGSITVWPLESAEDGPVPAVSFPTGSRAEVSYLGSTPLVDLGDQTVQVIGPDGAVQLDVPVTATAVLATPTDVVAYSETSLWSIPLEGEPQESALPAPAGAVGAPTAVTAANDTHLIALWATAEPGTGIAALIDVPSATILDAVEVTARAVRQDDIPLHSVNADTMTVGNLFIDYSAVPTVLELADVDPETINGNTVYGTKDGRAISATRNGDGFTVQPFPRAATGKDTLPAAATNSNAFIVADKVGDTFLYALPRQD